MVAYLLCAGFGTRMKPLTDETPKSLLPIGNRPIVDYLAEALASWTALDAVHVAVNQRDAPAFRDWASEWRPVLRTHDLSLHLHDDGVSTPDEQLGAVGDLQFLLEQTGLPADGALVSGGDSLYRFPLAPLLNAFDGTTSRVLALYEPDPEQRRQSSTLRMEGSRVESLVEDPSRVTTRRICPSWYLLTREALSVVQPYLDDGGDPDTLGRFLSALAQRHPVHAVRLPERAPLRLHCNSPDDLRHARALLRDEPRLLLSDSEVRRCLP